MNSLRDLITKWRDDSVAPTTASSRAHKEALEECAEELEAALSAAPEPAFVEQVCNLVTLEPVYPGAQRLGIRFCGFAIKGKNQRTGSKTKLRAQRLKEAIRAALAQPATAKQAGGTIGLDGDTARDWATDGPAWQKRAIEAEAKLYQSWNVEQILVYIWHCLGDEFDGEPYPYSTFNASEMGKRLRLGLTALAPAQAEEAGTLESLWTEREWRGFSAEERHRLNLAYFAGRAQRSSK